MNHRMKTIKAGGSGHWIESQVDEAPNDNLLRLKNANLNNRSNNHNEMRFAGGRVEMEDSQIVHSVSDSHGTPIHTGSDIHIEALRSLKWDCKSLKGQGRYDTAAL